MRLSRRWWLILPGMGVVLASALGAGGLWLQARYAVAQTMTIPLQEFSNAEYPEDPGTRSIHFDQYSGRKLTLVQKNATHFDFILDPLSEHVARVVFRDIDVSLITPGEPAWTKGDTDLERIALTDRQWNRQQVSFDPHSPHVEVSGGDGFEEANLSSAELAKNCLNAGLWEVLLFVKENGQKAMYYHGWFTFPLGHYKSLFEHNTGLSYWDHWRKLEHWVDPAGTPVRLDGLRQVVSETEVHVAFDPAEPMLAAGEQLKKQKIMACRNVVTWGNFFDGHEIRFASFVPPGRYSVSKPWKNDYRSLARFEKGILRQVVSPATSEPVQELELVFRHADNDKRCRFVVSGVDLAALPQLPVDKYPQGMYMPMGIGVPPFYQSYAELTKNTPERSPYFCVLLDDEERWINHHEVAIDGPVLHRDARNPNLVHLYLLSYERESLIGHFTFKREARGERREASGKGPEAS